MTALQRIVRVRRISFITWCAKQRNQVGTWRWRDPKNDGYYPDEQQRDISEVRCMTDLQNGAGHRFQKCNNNLVKRRNMDYYIKEQRCSVIHFQVHQPTHQKHRPAQEKVAPLNGKHIIIVLHFRPFGSTCFLLCIYFEKGKKQLSLSEIIWSEK